MSFLLFKAVRFGISEVKKHQAKKTQDRFPPDYHLNDYHSAQAQHPTVHLRSADTAKDSSSAAKAILDGTLRFLQFVLGLAVIGLYGRDINYQYHSPSGHVRPEWVYAVVTAFLATSTAFLYLLLPSVLKKRRPLPVPAGAHLPLSVWEASLCVLWLTAFGIFGKMYLGAGPHAQQVLVSSPSVADSGNGSTNSVNGQGSAGEMADVTRMRHAVWVDLTNLGLWLLTGVWNFLRWWSRKGANADREAVWGDDAEKNVPATAI